MFNCNVSIAFFIILLLKVESFVTFGNCYVLPEPTFEILKPKGIRISIPDERGLKFFALQGNVNKNIAPNELGDISGEVYKETDGKWSFRKENINLMNGDVVHYWSYAQVDGKTYRKTDQTWTVISEKGKTQNKSTEKYKTSAGELLLFNENFDSLNESVWQRDIRFPLDPDYEFCVYHNEFHQTLVQVASGKLRIKPVILEDLYGEDITAYGRMQLGGCTSVIPAECSRNATAFNILPPIISARFTTKNSFHFRYGKIEIRAKFSEGDWLYPEMWLQPKYDGYGPGYSSGRVILGLARGNDNLINTTNQKIFDSRKLDFGFRAGANTHVDDYMVSKIYKNGQRWTKDFHIYTTIWNSDGFQFLVDNQEVGRLNPEANGWLNNTAFDKMAPFDQEFYITIGLGIGGIRVFPDGTISSGNPKPWRNVEAKAMLKFWRAKNYWLPTWKRESGKMTSFEIDYIRVWSS
ncbi:beta-1,3-glucan-binding protein-like [Hylaeus anthracinus]|uniref:beta-1,3-glucan-binding protein-like n=1 Tax=Hylaeus anthracinus TaxID=313031 RepID=UPI0023B8AC63|nr:beta-1,3-glucan-binding protein-like [Hylaeus anthracinus]